MEEKVYYIVRLNGKLGCSYAALSLSEAMDMAEPTATDHIAWGIVKAKNERVARMLDPERWFTGVISLTTVVNSLDSQIPR